MSDHTLLVVFGVYCLGCLAWALIKPAEKPSPPVQFWGSDGEWHYLPGDEPDPFDPWDYRSPHDI